MAHDPLKGAACGYREAHRNMGVYGSRAPLMGCLG